MVDTLVSGASASRHVGSSPILGTEKREEHISSLFLCPIPIAFLMRGSTTLFFYPSEAATPAILLRRLSGRGG